jgi:hypothetical protein
VEDVLDILQRRDRLWPEQSVRVRNHPHQHG